METFKFAKAIYRAMNKMYEETEKQSMSIQEGHDEQGKDQD